VDLCRDGLGSPACYRRAGFEVRDSGHVFDHHGQLLGHVAYMKEDSGRDRPSSALAWMVEAAQARAAMPEERTAMRPRISRGGWAGRTP